MAWRIFITNQLQKRSPTVRNIIHSTEEANCVWWCNIGVESTHHFFFGCMFTLQVWYSCYAWFEISIVVPVNCTQHSWQHLDLVSRKSPKRAWRIVQVTIFSRIRHLGGGMERMLNLTKLKSQLSCKARMKFFSASFYEWSTFLKLSENFV